MPKSYTLRPHDICVLLQLMLAPELTFRDLATAVGLSLGEAHNSKKRLEAAGLLAEGSNRPSAARALELLVFGVPYVFPGKLGGETRGVPTAHSAPPLSDDLPSEERIVWPSAQGTLRGSALEPMCPCAPSTATANRPLYELLILVDALRVGRARERELARQYLESALKASESREG